jgi:hypothetical protein
MHALHATLGFDFNATETTRESTLLAAAAFSSGGPPETRHLGEVAWSRRRASAPDLTQTTTSACSESISSCTYSPIAFVHAAIGYGSTTPAGWRYLSRLVQPQPWTACIGGDKAAAREMYDETSVVDSAAGQRTVLSVGPAGTAHSFIRFVPEEPTSPRGERLGQHVVGISIKKTMSMTPAGILRPPARLVGKNDTRL